jgi:hypothetical protein
MNEMNTTTRRQLTLFVDTKYSKEIEKIRQEYNPVQYDLIKAHVTLCREDELENSAQIAENLASLNHEPITIHFDKIIRFSDEQGVCISALPDNSEYHSLRNAILKNTGMRFPEPHITLMHPRNASCTNEIFETIRRMKFPEQIRFDRISFIEQASGGKWNIVNEYLLTKER